MLELLLRKWSLMALIIFACLGVLGFSQWGAPHLADRLVERKAVEQAQSWQHNILNLLDNGLFTFNMDELTTKDRRSLDVFVQVSGSYRYDLWLPSGQILWSSNASRIGRKENNQFFSRVLAHGSIHVRRSEKAPKTIDGFKGTSTISPRRVIEIFLPVMRGSEFVGAIEHHFDTTDDIINQTNNIRYIVLFLSAVALLFSTTLVGQVIVHARRQKELSQKTHDTALKHATDASKRSEESVILSELNDWLQSSQSLDELYKMIQAFLTKLIPDCPGAIYTYSNSRDVLEGACAWNGGNLSDCMQADDCWGLRRGRVYNFGEHKVDFVCKHKPEAHLAPYCCIPIIAHGETVGLLHLEFPNSLEASTSSDCSLWANYKKVAAAAAEQISLAIANVRLRDQLRDQSIRDPLTGLFNRRYLLEGLRRELARSIRKKEPVALLSFDVDHFKKFNDNHGHDAGDTVLRAVGEAILNEFREEDIACRYGGEEFIVVLPGASASAAKSRAEKLRQEIEQTTVRYGGANLPPVTISIGISAAPECGISSQELINSADKALYGAKSSGRNCTVMASLAKIDPPEGDATLPSNSLPTEYPCQKDVLASNGEPATTNNAIHQSHAPS